MESRESLVENDLSSWNLQRRWSNRFTIGSSNLILLQATSEEFGINQNTL
ncbi:unnamed protein product [Arabidopsis lyrata]|uniref:Predicted protein n=1 Tax=Arabidopsis lyrata subsp. lyrata TaxID=81972 RepID=D7MST1_ARALL|nr:predicted protein [Arabidopsis lyrata subsp. lyrata]CAH8278691.1 unnamed protein product [Arabidopsis lyrata]